MRKLRILLSALSFSVACADLMAQNVPIQTVTNPNGSRTIKAGQQTEEANAMNRRYCELIGGTDITNERDQTTGADWLYTVMCQSGSAHQPPAIANVISRLGTEQPLAPMSGPVHSPTIPPPDSENGVQRNPFGKK
jgi:hypothetical protein